MPVVTAIIAGGGYRCWVATAATAIRLPLAGAGT